MQPAFAPGQIWTYRTRENEPESFLCILAVDDGNQKLGQVCSIALGRIALSNPQVEGGIQEMLPHAPITAAVLKEAVIDCVATDGPDASDPNVAEAYQQWRVPYDKGEAGVFTISPAEIVAFLEQAVNGALEERKVH